MTEHQRPEPRPIEPFAGPIAATAAVPGSKSHTNRALVTAALADGTSNLDGILLADDTEAMLDAITRLGATVERSGTKATVTGVRGGPTMRGDAPIELDVRMSGTSSRFLLPVLTALPGTFRLDGAAQLRARPFGPQIDALRALGAEIDGDRLPLTIRGRQLPGGTVALDGSLSSQFLSGLLLAGPLMSGPLTIALTGPLVSRPYVDLTLRTMADFGREATVGPEFDRFEIEPGPYRAGDVAIEPDASAASYFFAAAAIAGGTVRIEGLDADTVQGDLAFTEALAAMGASVEQGPGWTQVTGTGALRGIDIDMRHISDTVQTLAMVAVQAEGPTTMSGIGFIRHKETDRLAAVATELGRLGVRAEVDDDALTVYPGPVSPGVVHTYEDHRMAMSFALLGLVSPGIAIADPGCVAKTFPHYFSVLESLRPPT